jgi:choline-sulfatase
MSQRTSIRIAQGVAAILFLLAVAGCGKSRSAWKAKIYPAAPVVIVSIDTLRSDHLPMYGDTGVETPVLSAFRNQAILFEKAYSHVPLTLPSHATIFTGTPPAVNGLRDNLGYTLNPAVPTLAELLKKNGYATGGAISSVVLNAGSGIGRGFDFYEDTVEPTQANQALSRVQRSGAETEALLSKWLEARPSGRPFFAFLHLYEPHTPYEPPEPYASRYRNQPYDGEIAWADELTGRFFDVLKKNGVWDNALVIVLSDHGEGLGEHGEDEHGIFLYRYALQVPLMVKLPKGDRGGTSVAAPVQLSDVFATVVKAVGLPDVKIPDGTVSLLDLAAGSPPPARTIYAETIFPRIHFGWSDLASLLDGRWHYVEAPKPELYDLEKDPAENANLAPEKPQPFRTLRIEMEKRRAAFTAPAAVNPEEAKKLASLGYLSTGATAGAGPLPDPKDEIFLVRDLKEGSGLFHEKHYDEAIAIFRRLLDQNPRMLDVWDLYSQCLQKMGRNEEALAALKKGIQLSPEGATHYYLAVASLCLTLGKLDEAQKHAEIARDRGDAAAEDLLARVHLARKEWTAAEKSALAALKVRPNKRLAYLILARVAIARNELPKALELVDKASALGEGKHLQAIEGIHYLRGDILGRMERPAEAEAEFQQEIALFPGNLDAWSSLTALYASEGRLPAVRQTVKEMVTANPTPAAYELAEKTLRVVGDREGAAMLRVLAARKFPSDPRFRRGA